jgi:hypothetical protein
MRRALVARGVVVRVDETAGSRAHGLGYGYGRAIKPAQARLHPIHSPRSYRKIASNSSNLRWTWVSPSTRGTDRMRSAGSTTP